MKRVVALTGAGISRSSNIPTFEELGLEFRSKLSREYFNKYPDDGTKILNDFTSLITKARPNNAHYILSMYEIPIITTNIDDLHEKAGSTEVIHMHGVYYDKVVLYGDEVSEEAFHEASNLIFSCDTLLVIGSSRFTNTQDELLEIAKFYNKEIVVINRDCEREVLNWLQSA